MKIEFGRNVSMVDVCHIVTFAELYDDTITNGIALSPTFHRAFDHSLVILTDYYRVIVHPNLKDHYPLVGTQQFNRQTIQLPSDPRFYPSPAKREQHRKRFAF
jgi:putative restriction endonuclease